MKSKVLLIIIFAISLNVFAQSPGNTRFNEISNKLLKEKDETKKAGLYYQAARFYFEKEGNIKTDLDSASLFNKRSIRLSSKLGMKKELAQNMLLEGEIAAENGDSAYSSKLKYKALQYALSNGLKTEAAAVYMSIAYEVPENDLLKKEQYFLKAADLYRQAGAFLKEAETRTELSVLYNGLDEIDTSIKFALDAVKIKKKIKEPALYKEYTMLAMDYRTQGKYENALAYALAADKVTETTPEADALWRSIIKNLIGTIYSELKFYDKSVEYYKKAIAISKENNDTEGVTSITINTARGLLGRGKVAEALEVLNNGYKYYHKENCDIEYASLYILLYCELKKHEKAKPYYDQLVTCASGQVKNPMEQEKMYYAMIHYLLKTGQAAKTYGYIEKLKQLSRKNNDIYNLTQLEKTHFEVDSATGNYLGAIQHLKNYKQLNDSVFNINNTKQFADLQLKYDTEKKDRNIKLLTNKSQLQQARIENELVIRYIFIGSVVVLCIIIGLLYSRYCMKRKTNAILEAKQDEINRKNNKLERLVAEKEWLLKEIHHRVKNNLQIVISLLNTQSAYLDNEEALEAIQNSQHRMHAMSLIHQKLYQTENLSSINMPWYIKELADYLKDSFDHEGKIKFKLSLAAIDLDVAQAVPLGLILNEAITNAIKYAFPERKGIINILLEDSDNNYLLRISDNGIGLPEHFESAETDSLGMNLMIGLAEQLDGTFTIQSGNGVIITINFIKRQAAV
ncbi:histidine kinase dimerization/phosphoacceptor domain -containing protein [Flavobacterium sp. DGU11]|uniref:histidine kinase n=1 Tax=Flavobacterium arundinis TaxID=3139143 RepID=A0ABU9HZ00_9FLAO